MNGIKEDIKSIGVLDSGNPVFQEGLSNLSTRLKTLQGFSYPVSSMERMSPQNPLYLHGSDGPNTVSVEKLTGVSNYRRWRRSMEIALSSKRKLGFVKGSVVKEQADTAKAELWDTCNDTVIGWIMGSVSDSIKQTIMYMLREIWMYLESRYSVSNGSLKYKLNRELYSFKQGGATINDYYTAMRGMWEELESLDQLPTITTVGEDVTRFLEALEKQKEEKRLFQFLNGVDEVYGPQRSQLLMMTTLPSVEFACSSLQQEESQRCVLNPMKAPLESSAMYSKGATDPETCSACGVKGHPRERCWTVIGYPKWHPKHKALYKSRKEAQKVAANAQGGSSLGDNGEITVQQLEHLLRNLHNKPRSTMAGSDTEDELDSSFAGFAAVGNRLKINLPNGNTSDITHCGGVKLKNGLNLKKVLVVPEFKHNLLSVNKLVSSEDCKVDFYAGHCVIVDNVTQKEHSKQHFEEEERRLLPLLEAAELTKLQQVSACSGSSWRGSSPRTRCSTWTWSPSAVTRTACAGSAGWSSRRRIASAARWVVPTNIDDGDGEEDKECMGKRKWLHPH
ncbi:unnamed protein product [Cuscuta campestris]|uniref:Retrotransposon Copia-like N-terminal domain-containing protein n=1 Tax=Cuscuta campestris TaxID=132261 RepID=A0A484KEF1_9ASTE|nr:unnamed protein product [Cuscuta campestris]